jgi:hypothetical protein
MSFQLFNDGACIRIEQIVNGQTKTLMVAKDQVKTIDIIKDNIIRIDIGEGPLKNIFINFQDVTLPVAPDAVALRTAINEMMKSDIYEGGDARENTQLSVLTKLGDIATILASIKERETDISQLEPSRIDESNPNMVYRGWHSQYGFVDIEEWAIERVRRVDDEVISEWAAGSKNQVNSWLNRADLQYYPYNHELPMGG